MKNKKPVIFLTFANDKVDDALYLRNLPLELHNIREALQPAVQAGLCEVVERTAATIDQIFDIFQDPYYKDRIALFHYGGHASGTQLMFETLDGGHGSSHSEGLVPFFGKQKGLQLVFINGCSSQQQAVEMMDAGIPAVVGTSMAIKDTIATELSKRFYNGLASGMTIDHAWQQSIDSIKTKTGTKKTKGLRLRRDKSADFPWNMYVREGSEIVKDWNLPMAVNNPLFGLPKLPRNHNLPETPFMFLHRYEEEHAEVFFGRGQYIRDLYNRASDEHAAPVILLYGQSGVGKSSLLESGLMPRLARENQVNYIRRDFTMGILNSMRAALDLKPILPTHEIANEAENVSDDEEHQEFDRLEAEFQEKLAPLQALLPTLDDELKDEVQEAIERITSKHRQEYVSTAEDGYAHIDYNSEESAILQRWKAIEAETGEPLVMILDQAEEIFTKEHPDLPNELDDFFSEMNLVFHNVQTKPKGRLILSYRKEFHSEIEEACKTHQIPREQIFLKALGKEEIQSVILGLTTTPKLQKRYELKIEENLPEIIADDLLEDKDSAISPVLQILLTKLWNMAVEERTPEEDHHSFSIDNYQELKKQGILMDDFFYQQMAKLEEWSPGLVQSGLAIDVLNFHTTRLGSATVQDIEDIKERYKHRSSDVEKLVVKLKELYLLTDAGLGKTGLAHDSIAPLIQDMMRTSDSPGQRAYRILRNKVPSFEAFPETIIDADDLELVEEGVDGMRLWTMTEEELIEVSRKKRERDRRRMFIIRMIGVAALVVIICLSIFAGYQAIEARRERAKAERNADEAHKQAKIAKENEKEAIHQKGLAQENAAEALRQRAEAITQKQEAERQRGIAEVKTEEARQNAAEANRQRGLAEKNEAEAIKQQKLAVENAEEARKQTIIAEEKTELAKQKTREVEAQLALEKSKTEASKAASLAMSDDFEEALDVVLDAYEELKKAQSNKSQADALPTEVYNSLNSVYESMANELGNNVFVRHPHMARDIEFNAPTDRIAFSTFTGKKTGQIYLIRNEANGSRDRQILDVDNEVRTIRFSPNGNLLLAGTIEGRVFGWDYNSRTEKYEKFQVFEENSEFAPPLSESDEAYSAKNAILSIAFSAPPHKADLYYMAICTQHAYSIFEMDKDGGIIKRIQYEKRPMKYCMFSHTGKYFTIITSEGAEILSYNIKDDGRKKWIKSKTIKMPNATETSFSFDEKLIAVGSKKGDIILYNLEQEKQYPKDISHKSPLSALKFSPDNTKLITSSLDHTVKFFDLTLLEKNGNEKLPPPITLLGAQKWIWDLTFSKDNKYIYAISEDKAIRKWPTDIEILYNKLKEAKDKKLYLNNKFQRSN